MTNGRAKNLYHGNTTGRRMSRGGRRVRMNGWWSLVVAVSQSPRSLIKVHSMFWACWCQNLLLKNWKVPETVHCRADHADNHGRSFASWLWKVRSDLDDKVSIAT